MSLKIRNALNRDMPAIVQMIGEFQLDYENLQPQQFIVVEDGDVMVGFGRLQTYPDATDLGCVGVLHERRRQGIGKLIVDELIRRGPSRALDHNGYARVLPADWLRRGRRCARLPSGTSWSASATSPGDGSSRCTWSRSSCQHSVISCQPAIGFSHQHA